MRRNVLDNTCGKRVFLDDFPHCLPGKPRARTVEEKGVGLGCEQRAALRKVRAQQIHGSVMQRHQTFLAPLAEHPHHAPLKIHIQRLQSRHFRNPQTGRIHELQHGPIPAAKRRNPIRGGKQSAHFIHGEHVGD